MTRGGKRSGAGRPPKLDYIQRLWVGSFCEVEWRKAIKEKLEYTIRNDPSMEGYRALIAEQAKILESKRSEYLGSEAFSTHQYDVETELRDATNWNMDGERNAPRLREYRTTKPQGLQPEIICRAREQIKQRYGILNISDPTIRKCWDEFRKFEKSLDSET
jgi:hypothetical protein